MNIKFDAIPLDDETALVSITAPDESGEVRETVSVEIKQTDEENL